MSNISIKSLCRLIAVSALLLFSVGCSDHKKQEADAFKEGVAAFGKGDYPVALEKFKSLAEQGNAEAQYNLGMMYMRGIGVSQDTKQAMELWTKAADQGNNANAQFNLGVLYRQGKGVPADDKRAVSYWAKAAEQGHIQAQLYVGIMYAQGAGTTQDKTQAYKWFSIAASKGNPAAVQNLNTVSMHMEPAQIEQAKSQAQEWLANHQKK
ncbi:MAG: tetratricopeptide repeat protein [Gallionellaceae bacterium]